MYNKGEDEGKNKGKRCKGEAEGEQVKELNDESCTRCLGGKENQPALVQFTDGQSEDHPVYSGRLIYISTVCTYVALLTSQQIDKWSVHMVRAQMTS